jgi:hypothetical protein
MKSTFTTLHKSKSILRRYSRKSSDEVLDHIRNARIGWEQGILEELRAIIYEAHRPFLQLR